MPRASKKPRQKFCYIGAPAYFALDLACADLWSAFDTVGVYIVGSCLQRPDFRDVDVRLMMADEAFAALFPDVADHWEMDPRWLLLTVGISKHLADVTGLPIDFQLQPMTHANKQHKGCRQPIGIRIWKPECDV